MLEKKTIECRLTVVTGRDNYDICSFVETYLNASPLNNSEFRLNIIETKVIKSEPYANPIQDVVPVPDTQ